MTEPRTPTADQTRVWSNADPDPNHTQLVPPTADGYALAATDSVEHAALTSVGDYRLEALLGEGGMGAVYRAVRASTGRVVALKVLSRQVAGRAGFRQRFHREVRAMSLLIHPNIVRALAAGEADGHVYLAMELLEGGSVADRVSRDGPMTPSDGMAVGVAAARALEFAHQNLFIHRDVKPDNLLLTADGQVKLTDLGLAKATDDTDVSLTGTGTGMGTPMYAPVEQIRDAKRADARSDLYALGGVIYFALTGHPPFTGSNFLELVKAKEKGVYPSASTRNSAVPAGVDKMLSKLLARLPEHRYQTAGEFLQDAEWGGFTGDRIE